MNMELANALTGEARAEYMALARMFETEGWRYFVKRMHAELDSARQRKEHAVSWETNRVAHGEVYVYTTLTELDDAVESEYASIAIQESDEGFQ